MRILYSQFSTWLFLLINKPTKIELHKLQRKTNSTKVVRNRLHGLRHFPIMVTIRNLKLQNVKAPICTLTDHAMYISVVLVFAYFYDYLSTFIESQLTFIQFTHIKYTIQWLLVYSQSCTSIATINFRTFLLP